MVPFSVKKDLTQRGMVTHSLIGSLWKDNRFYYDGTTILYVCKSMEHKASTSTGDKWHIWKHTFDASDNITRSEGPLIGNADDRASLGWGA